ncbi:hypothetical protein HPB51_014024 [Rhipicephalus microplus]|uniref:Uncharacterized protein n=1 Tax=Rhipicephalus microplus TaxID=6941 RepID=A0A9J6DAT6_RHIMP|nr:hypothetical protein HPB51_014024 [Rhipicephalus microplus]
MSAYLCGWLGAIGDQIGAPELAEDATEKQVHLLIPRVDLAFAMPVRIIVKVDATPLTKRCRREKMLAAPHAVQRTSFFLPHPPVERGRTAEACSREFVAARLRKSQQRDRRRTAIMVANERGPALRIYSVPFSEGGGPQEQLIGNFLVGRKTTRAGRGKAGT